MRTSRLGLPLGLYLLACPVYASLMLIPESAFSPAAPVVTFTVDITQSLPYSESGATFSSFSGPMSSVLSLNNFLFMAGDGTLVVTFGSPVSRAGFFFFNSLSGTQSLTASVFSGIQDTTPTGQISLGTFLPEGSGGVNQGVVAFQSDSPFSRVDLTFTNLTPPAPNLPPDSYLIDDFRFESAIPEPATLALIALPLAGLLGRSLLNRRKKLFARTQS